MLEKIRRFLLSYKDVAIYLIFGVLTTLVSYAIYFPLYNLMLWQAALCNVLSWIGAVAFAFVTNKIFVFHSKDWPARLVFSELFKFIASRLASLVAETAIIFVAVEFLLMNGNVVKIVASVIVVIMNYITSKLIVFRKKYKAE